MAYYCEACRTKRKLITRSEHQVCHCEFCGETHICHNSDSLALSQCSSERVVAYWVPSHPGSPANSADDTQPDQIEREEEGHDHIQTRAEEQGYPRRRRRRRGGKRHKERLERSRLRAIEAGAVNQPGHDSHAAPDGRDTRRETRSEDRDSRNRTTSSAIPGTGDKVR